MVILCDDSHGKFFFILFSFDLATDFYVQTQAISYMYYIILDTQICIYVSIILMRLITNTII